MQIVNKKSWEKVTKLSEQKSDDCQKNVVVMRFTTPEWRKKLKKLARLVFFGHDLLLAYFQNVPLFSVNTITFVQ